MKGHIESSPSLFSMPPFQPASKEQDYGLWTEDKWGIGHLTFFPETHKSGSPSTLKLLFSFGSLFSLLHFHFIPLTAQPLIHASVLYPTVWETVSLSLQSIMARCSAPYCLWFNAAVMSLGGHFCICLFCCGEFDENAETSWISVWLIRG